MATLKRIAEAASLAAPSNHSMLIYGPPKGGKTRLVGTAARIPEVNRIFWFDIENGSEALQHMNLDDEAMEKLIVFRIPDTKDNPVAIETMLKVFSAKSPVPICELHGKVSCSECAKSGEETTPFSLGMCTHNDLVVIDSGSQLGDSALAATVKGKDPMFKPGWDEYGLQGKWLADILSVIQQAYHTNFVVITHEIVTEDFDGKDKYFPLMGSKTFSMKVAKYFGTVAYVHKKLNKHTAASSSTYRGDVLTGSRLNAAIEKAAEPDMRQILIDGGILKNMGTSSKNAVPAQAGVVEVPQEKPPAQGGLAAKLAAKQAGK